MRSITMAFLAAVSLILCTSREVASHCEESYEEGHLVKIDYAVARCPRSDLGRRWGPAAAQACNVTSLQI